MDSLSVPRSVELLDKAKEAFMENLDLYLLCLEVVLIAYLDSRVRAFKYRGNDHFRQLPQHGNLIRIPDF
jgi:hypothetical protein